MKRLVKALLKCFLSEEFIQKYRERQRSQPLLKYGDEALSILLKTFCNYNISSDYYHFSVMFGTLLGAYREHGFIKHDDDLDIVCDIQFLSEKLIYELQGKGFEINKIYVSSDKVGVQLPMKYKGLTCDIYFKYRDTMSNYEHIYVPYSLENRDWQYSATYNIFRVQDVQIPISNSYIKTKFGGYEIEIPSNTDDILKKIYGENYMTPIKGEKMKPVCFSLTEKLFSFFPIDIFLEIGMIEKIRNRVASYNAQ